MTTRILPPEEWPRLAGTLLEDIWPSLDARYAEVIVVEREDEIVGSVALLNTLHAECLSTQGGTDVARALWCALQERVKAAGGSAVWGAAVDEPMRSLLMKHAEPIPGEHFLVKV